PCKTKRITDRIHLLPNLQVSRIAQRHWRQVWGFNLNYGKIMRPICTHYGDTIFLAIVQRDFDLARAVDHVVIGQNVAIAVDNEAGALPLLRHQSIEKVQGYRLRRDIDDRADVLVINGNIVLFFGVKRLGASGFGNLNFRWWRVYGAKSAGAVGSEIKEPSHKQDRNRNRTE